MIMGPSIVTQIAVDVVVVFIAIMNRGDILSDFYLNSDFSKSTW